MIVMSFDLSTECIGVLAVEITNKEITKMKSCPIIPPKFCPSRLGFMKSKKSLPYSKGSLNTYYYKGEKSITKKEKSKRDLLVREETNNFLLTELSKEMNFLIENIKPDLVNIEKNAMFRGTLTIELLARLHGTLVGIVSSKNIPFNEYRVQVVRKKHNPAKLVQDFVSNKSPEYIASLPDTTKAALRELMQAKYAKYGLDIHTDDESDAVCVFDYWYENVFLCR